jgi:hypothetical protein
MYRAPSGCVRIQCVRVCVCVPRCVCVCVCVCVNVVFLHAQTLRLTYTIYLHKYSFAELIHTMPNIVAVSGDDLIKYQRVIPSIPTIKPTYYDSELQLQFVLMIPSGHTVYMPY